MLNHKCDVPDIDYSNANSGLIRCGGCGRTWSLAYKDGKVTGWKPDPKPAGGRSVKW
jgi:hypothetical protein